MKRNETYHPVIKSLVNGQLSLHKAVRRIKDHLQDIDTEYDCKINFQRKFQPVLLDKYAFFILKPLLTHYCLGKYL